MASQVDVFIDYLATSQNKSENTLLSYRRDLSKLEDYCTNLAITDITQVSAENLASYMEYLDASGFKPTTISRNVASLHAFFHFMYERNEILEDVSVVLQAPKVEKKIPEILTVKEINNLLAQPNGDDPKEIRDKAMLELLYATGIRVSELIGLNLSDVDMKMSLLTCKSRIIPFGEQARLSLERYFEAGRAALLHGNDSDILFPNCSGEPMSRQGFWKLLKVYGKRAGIKKELTPHTLRHSFAAHMMEGGADIKSVSMMLGHSNVSTTQVYAQLGKNKLRSVYAEAHPRK